MKRQVLAAAVSVLLVHAGTARAGAPDPDRPIKFRQGLMQVFAWNMGPMGAMAKGEAPFDKEVVARKAEYLAAVAPLLAEAFPPGSEKGAKVTTRAKADIWKDTERAKTLMEQLRSESSKLAQVARSGDEAAIKSQIGATGKVCQGCHEKFREEEKK